MRLEIDPENAITIGELKKIKRKERMDRLNMQLKTHTKNMQAINNMTRITKEEGDIELERKVAEGIKNTFLKQKEQKVTPIEKARDLIYSSEDVISAAQEIKGLIEGEREEDTKFVLAELYAKAGTADRARKLLTGYKKSLDSNTTKREYMKLVNKAIELVSSKRIKRFDWDEWWKQKRELGSIDGEDVSANGTFKARKDEGR